MLCQGNCKKFQGSVLHKLFAKVDNVQSFRQKSAAATKNFLLRKIGLNVFLTKSFQIGLTVVFICLRWAR